MNPKKVVLFICSGNSCRSPMCEYILKDQLRKKGILDHFLVLSAGVSATDGNEMSENAKLALKHYGIEEKHKSTALTSELLTKADYVFCMTSDHKKQIQESFGNFEKVKTLEEVLKVGDIPDPYRKGLDVYMDCAKLLTSVCSQLIENILSC